MRFNSYSDFTAGRGERVDEIFDNLPTILGRKPKTMADFAQKNVDSFRY
jgi:NAD(P)H dehydrogenase (quinone)